VPKPETRWHLGQNVAHVLHTVDVQACVQRSEVIDALKGENVCYNAESHMYMAPIGLAIVTAKLHWLVLACQVHV